MPRILISAAHKSSGKTTVSVGLCAALAARGLAVQPFKKGPDYIDPMWLGQAAGRPCFNLDPYLMGWDEIRRLFRRGSRGADISIVEGNKGLYDGLALDGSNSNAALASALDLPVVLVLDARGMTRGIAPLILGYQAFDPGIRIAGVILNNLGGKRHEAKLRAVIEHYTDVEVLGAIQNNPDLSVVERHLGLIPSNEAEDAAGRVASIGRLVADQVDLDRFMEVARSAAPYAPEPACVAAASAPQGQPVRIAVARDRAFGFYYADDLLGLEAAGAVLVPFDALKDAHLPPCDGLFIGGGFPESFAAQLAANTSLREEIRDALAAGLPAYAECGGLMYLARSLNVDGTLYPMVGAVPGDVVMHRKPVGRGYVHLAQTGDSPWAPCDCASRMVRAHEFHYSSIENLPSDLKYAWRVERGHGVDGRRDGIVVNNLLASYCHLRMAGGCGWTDRFASFVRAHRDRRVPATPAI
ncbi:MAG: cobyrinate a,c-diamide synthase [Rhodocyclaceae bacterium]|nr:cobyrinate a,c-diamide synthase [Rhodocyclaceae bacterium]